MSASIYNVGDEIKVINGEFIGLTGTITDIKLKER